jgi:hypothetical protein
MSFPSPVSLPHSFSGESQGNSTSFLSSFSREFAKISSWGLDFVAQGSIVTGHKAGTTAPASVAFRLRDWISWALNLLKRGGFFVCFWRPFGSHNFFLSLLVLSV